jgi:type II secretory pathway component PulF
MSDPARSYAYTAIDNRGRKVRGAISATSEDRAFLQLKQSGLTPLRLAITAKPSAAASGSANDRQVADFLSDLAALLKAGADLRSALSILGGREDGALARLCRQLAEAIGGGEAVDRAFVRALPQRYAFVAALIAAGEASGDLAGGLRRAGDMLAARIKLRDQLVSTLSYPAFVLASTVAAFLVIILFLVPSLAPLVEESGQNPGGALPLLLALSDFLRENSLALGVAFGIAALGLGLAAWSGALTKTIDRALLLGPLRRTVGALVYGAYSIALGDMLAAGSPMTQSLRLAANVVRSPLARERLKPVAASVREGERLSDGLSKIDGFPPAIVRLAIVGESSGALGPMLARAGRLEEENALRRIEAGGRILGPAAIVLLGGMVGLLMAGLLTGIQELGDTALR